MANNAYSIPLTVVEHLPASWIHSLAEIEKKAITKRFLTWNRAKDPILLHDSYILINTPLQRGGRAYAGKINCFNSFRARESLAEESPAKLG